MRIRPTELGCKGLMLLGALELAFLATSYSNLFFLLITFCCVLGALGIVWAITNLRAVEVALVDVPPAAAGAPRPVLVELRARGRGALDLAVELRLGRTAVEIAHRDHVDGVVRLAGELPPRARGIVPVTTVQLATRHPFGFFVARRVVRIPALELVTHPAPHAGRANGSHGDAGDRQAPNGDPAPSVAGLRPFRPGDAPNAVHWPATARRGTPIVKERDHEAGDRCDLVLDRRGDGAPFEAALATATGLLLAAHAQGRSVRLRSQDTDLRLPPDRAGAHHGLRWLAAATPLPADAPPPPPAPGAVRLPLAHGAAAAVTNPAAPAVAAHRTLEAR